MTTVTVTSAAELLDALAAADDIEVDGSLAGMPVITLRPTTWSLDNWGEVGAWTTRAPVTSRGPSGIGFVNFGTLDRLDVQAPVTTYGAGARGFNVYDGRLDSARFESITTHADGAVGSRSARTCPPWT